MSSGFTAKVATPDSNGSGMKSLMLPFARKTDPNVPVRFESVNLAIERNLFSELFRTASDPEPILLALWQTLLWRFSGQSEVVVGVVSASIRILPVAVTFAADIPFTSVVQAVLQAKSRAEEVQDSPAANPNVGFAFENGSFYGTQYAQPPGFFEVMLRIRTDLKSCSAELVYNPAAFPRDAVERMGSSFTAMLSGLLAEPNSRADALPLLNARDYEQIVIGFNQSAVPYPKKCVHTLFEEQVQRTPENIALRFKDQTFTYRELNVRANQLAHHLRAKGVGANVPVALFVERSAEMIIGLLAIIKAGGCFVPLLHDEPYARLEVLLDQIQAPALLTTRKLHPRLPKFAGEIVLFDELRETDSGNPENLTTVGDLVCVIYTSGSTGVPKGVAARHSNLANYCEFIRDRLEHPQGWHFATVSTIGAILGNTSVFGALMSGGCLHVIDYETGMSPRLFADYLAKHPIDVIKITPSQLGGLLAGAEGRCVLPRKYVVVGGEKFTWELLQHIRDNGDCRIMNHFGPTETMGCCTFIVDEKEFLEWKPATVPLGRPMSNQQLYVVDRNLRPVPIGVAGELCMSGAGLTDGYFRQPQQTAEKFVANPFKPGARLYRTGDQARFLPDGNIEFLGRIDHQLKIRGFRVEPEEVEAAIKRHPGVKQVVIVPEESNLGETILAAYVVITQKVNGSELRSFLRQQLPDYMIPSRLLALPSLPLNRNGKVDLTALSALCEPEKQTGSAKGEAHSDTEEKLVEIWAEVLQKDNVGIHDDFFELGGHSLLAIQIISRIRNAFRVEFPLFSFLESPTIADLAVKMTELPHVETEEEEMERLVRELDQMSDEEAEKLLAADKKSSEAAGSTAE
jgi:amino acid adenylation domain-containing protein